MAELDKFIKIIPGSEKIKVNIDLHDLTHAFQGDYLTNSDINRNKESGTESVKSQGKPTTSAAQGTNPGQDPGAGSGGASGGGV